MKTKNGNKISDNFKDAHKLQRYVVTDGEGTDDNGEPSNRPMFNVLKKNEI